jgi:8-oxo-dGTP pyrophosphatase MutT (NUDIX family)
MNNPTTPAPPPMEAATVVVARNVTHGIEVLMLRKNSKIHFGGMWVFPGGKVDHADADAQSGDPFVRFRNAATREAEEEAGIRLDGSALVHFSHWLPPPVRPVRFSTHFFIAAAPPDLADVEIDGGEITAYKWMNATEALERRHRGEIEVVTPTFVTLDWLRRFTSVNDAIASIQAPIDYHTHIISTDNGNIAFYAGDVAYDSLDPTQPGPRRRANMFNDGWWWEEHDGNGTGPATQPLDFATSAR